MDKETEAVPAAAGREARPTGTQSIERAICLLKLLATRGTFGWGLTDLARRSGLDKATVHRILGCLELERLVERDVQEHRYFPGPMLVDLGLSVSSCRPLIEQGRVAAARLAQRVRAAGFFYLRSGSDFVVAERVEQVVHRGMLNEVGYRRPLIMAAGGVAMLAAMPRDECEVIAERNLRELSAMGIPRIERFERMLLRAIDRGHAVNVEDVVAGIHSFAVSVPDRAGLPMAALAVAGSPQELPLDAEARWIDALSKEAAELGLAAPGLSTGRAGATRGRQGGLAPE